MRVCDIYSLLYSFSVSSVLHATHHRIEWLSLDVCLRHLIKLQYRRKRSHFCFMIRSIARCRHRLLLMNFKRIFGVLCCEYFDFKVFLFYWIMWAFCVQIIFQEMCIFFFCVTKKWRKYDIGEKEGFPKIAAKKENLKNTRGKTMNYHITWMFPLFYVCNSLFCRCHSNDF